MYKTCNTEHSVNRQQQLEDCLLKNMLLKPYAEISISDLCEQASISRKTFYRYFGSKEGCLCALLDRIILSSSQSLPPNEVGSLSIEDALFQLLSFWKEQADLLQALIANDLADRLLAQLIHHMRREETLFLAYIGLADEGKSNDALLFYSSGFVAVLLNWAHEGFQRTAKQVAAALSALYTKPLISPV